MLLLICEQTLLGSSLKSVKQLRIVVVGSTRLIDGQVIPLLFLQKSNKLEALESHKLNS